eukprot:TRINITY_DN1988_c4_g1_i2.p1 TRINITY_DN1988_c4_g1~~TRINITY_DN1988_c4_g1_i2.p1  ORF type:complete len:945 (-),score=174.96 TRINITY_DN1988_c4_g1_i2:7-2841(-)
MGGQASKKSFASRQTLLLRTQEPYNGIQLDGLPVIAYEELKFPYTDLLSPRSGEESSKNPTMSSEGELSGFLSARDHSTIGFGAAGIVRKAKFRGNWVALKALRAGADAKEFANELENLRQLKHPCVVEFLGIVKEPLLIILEFVSYGSLYQLLHEFTPISDPISNPMDMRVVSKDKVVALPWELKFRIATDITAAMVYLHQQNYAHRDLKPGNILIASLSPDADVCAKICDLGTTRALSLGSMMTAEVGTLVYQAPEVMAGSTTYSKAVDVYSFGILLWELVTHSKPFADASFGHEIYEKVMTGERPEIGAGFPEAVAQLIREAWSSKAEDRPVFGEIHRRLKEICLSTVRASNIAHRTLGRHSGRQHRHSPSRPHSRDADAELEVSDDEEFDDSMVISLYASPRSKQRLSDLNEEVEGKSGGDGGGGDRRQSGSNSRVPPARMQRANTRRVDGAAGDDNAGGDGGGADGDDGCDSDDSGMSWTEFDVLTFSSDDSDFGSDYELDEGEDSLMGHGGGGVGTGDDLGGSGGFDDEMVKELIQKNRREMEITEGTKLAADVSSDEDDEYDESGDESEMENAGGASPKTGRLVQQHTNTRKLQTLSSLNRFTPLRLRESMKDMDLELAASGASEEVAQSTSDGTTHSVGDESSSGSSPKRSVQIAEEDPKGPADTARQMQRRAMLRRVSAARSCLQKLILEEGMVNDEEMENLPEKAKAQLRLYRSALQKQTQQVVRLKKDNANLRMRILREMHKYRKTKQKCAVMAGHLIFGPKWDGTIVRHRRNDGIRGRDTVRGVEGTGIRGRRQGGKGGSYRSQRRIGATRRKERPSLSSMGGVDIPSVSRDPSTPRTDVSENMENVSRSERSSGGDSIVRQRPPSSSYTTTDDIPQPLGGQTPCKTRVRACVLMVYACVCQVRVCVCVRTCRVCARVVPTFLSLSPWVDSY